MAAPMPTSVSTGAVTSVQHNSAIASATVVSGGRTIVGRGVVFGTTPDPGGVPYPPYFENARSYPVNEDTTFSISLNDLEPNTTYYVKAYAHEEWEVEGVANSGSIYGGEVSFTTSDVPVLPDIPTPVTPTTNNSLSRELFFKVELLDETDSVLQEKAVKLKSGRVDVGSGGARRKCTLELLEPLPDDWQGRRWRLYYGHRTGHVGEPIYHALGVFIPVNPSEYEAANGLITMYQGVDKMKLFGDYQLPEPLSFASGTPVRDIIVQMATIFGETKLNLEKDLGTLGADFTVEEGITAESFLNTLVSSFSAEMFYDAEGWLVARKTISPDLRPIRFAMDDDISPLYISSEKIVDDLNYYNSVTVVGGRADTDIYRASLSNSDAIDRAKRVVHRYFTIDAAVSQAQVDGRASYYLSQGVQLPFNLRLTNLVIPNLEQGDIISKDGRRYEVRAFNIPLGLGEQNITAGEVID